MLLGSTAVKSSTPALGIAVAVDMPGGGKDEGGFLSLIGEYFCLFTRHNEVHLNVEMQLTIAITGVQAPRAI
jgi:hypothetical protein